MLTFPLSMTYDHLAAYAVRLEPNFAEDNCDPSDEDGYNDTPAHFLRAMLDYFVDADLDPAMIAKYKAGPHYNSLCDYLRAAGFHCYDDRVEVESESSLTLAAAIFSQISFEYDRILPEGSVVDPENSTPTWKLFNLSGDDDVDYYSSQPTYVTDLLLRMRVDTAL